MGVLLDRMHPKHLFILAAIFILVLYFTVLGTSPARRKVTVVSSQQYISSVPSSDRERPTVPEESVDHRVTKPHIVFILADDLGYNDVSYHGSEIRTPNLDRLSGEGVRLENYYVQQMCSPSRSQLMTGRYQIHTGLQHACLYVGRPSCMPTDLPTLPEKLREAGYATHMVGKWHLGLYKAECLPLNRGFDSFYGILGGRADHYGHNNTFEDSEENVTYTGYDFRDGHDVDWSADGRYDMDLYTDRALRIIKGHTNTNKPLFLYVPYQAIHKPVQAPQEYIEPFQYIENETRRVVAAMTDTIDQSVQEIIDLLKAQDMWNNTVLVFSSDNGADQATGNNWPLRGWKNSLWEGGIRAVGFIVSELLPHRVRGTVHRQLMDMSDWFPTLVEGVASHQLKGVALDGYNMWDALRFSSQSQRNEILHNIDPYPDNPDTFSVNITAAIRYEDWKLLTGDPGAYGGVWVPTPDSGLDPVSPPVGDNLTTVWLFNITEDPNERVDLSEQYPDVVEHLVDKLRFYYAGAVPVNFPDSSPQSNPDLNGGVWGPYDPDPG